MKQKLCKLLAVLLAVGMVNMPVLPVHAAGSDIVEDVVQERILEECSAEEEGESVCLNAAADNGQFERITDDLTEEVLDEEVVLKESRILLKDKSKTYNGKRISIGLAKVTGSTGKVTYTYYTDKKCTSKTTTKTHGASSKGGAPANAGTYYVVAQVEADDSYAAAASNVAKLTINKAAQDIDVDNTSKTWKDSYVKSAARTFNIDAYATDGSISCEKVSGSSSLSISKSGKVKINKGTKAGSYTMKVRITAASTKNYKKATKTVKISVTVKKTETSSTNNGGGGSSNNGTVYWVAGGEVYHSTKGCRSLSRSRNIYSGSVSEAKSQGKTRPCKNCH
ncbi:MAG: hypothetical protein PUB22_04475 [Clostridiales bacterium]|nr:hypothetical protein [Clostridiales bacterium]